MEKQVYNPAFNVVRFKRGIGVHLNKEMFKPFLDTIAGDSKVEKLAIDVTKCGLDELHSYNCSDYGVTAFGNGCHIQLTERMTDNLLNALDQGLKSLYDDKKEPVPPYLFSFYERLDKALAQQKFRRAA